MAVVVVVVIVVVIVVEAAVTAVVEEDSKTEEEEEDEETEERPKQTTLSCYLASVVWKYYVKTQANNAFMLLSLSSMEVLRKDPSKQRFPVT